MNTSHTDNARGIDDLTVLIVFTLGAAAALLIPGVPWPVEWVFGLPLLLWAPGYALVTALFPIAPVSSRGATGAVESRDAMATDDPPAWSARVAMALVLSAATVVLVGISLSVVGVLELISVVVALVAITHVATWIAWRRRRDVAANRRADILPVIAAHTRPGTLGLSTNQAAALGIAILLLGAGTAAAGILPSSSETYSEAALVSPDDGMALGTNGTLQLTAGKQHTVTLRLENHERGTVTYGVVGLLQDVTVNGTVVETRELERGQVTVADGETQLSDRTFRPFPTDHRTRLQYLIYTGPVPENPSPETAVLSLRIWVDFEGTTVA